MPNERTFVAVSDKLSYVNHIEYSRTFFYRHALQVTIYVSKLRHCRTLEYQATVADVDSIVRHRIAVAGRRPPGYC